MDQAKVEVIEKLPPPVNIKGLRSFLGYARFYRRFIKDFSKITKPPCQLLHHDVSYVFSQECTNAFKMLKKALISTPIMKTHEWTKHFELCVMPIIFPLGLCLVKGITRCSIPFTMLVGH